MANHTGYFPACRAAPRIAEAGTNYLVCQLVLGDMTLSEALRSIELFARRVMPALQASSAKSAVA
jgi:hypothetical protein